MHAVYHHMPLVTTSAQLEVICPFSNYPLAGWRVHYCLIIALLHIQVPTVRRIKSTLSLLDFYHTSQLLGTLGNSLVYRAAFMLSFFGFLRISNLVPPKQDAFDVHRQLCFRDVNVCEQGVYVFLRRAKNLQRTDPHIVLNLHVKTRTMPG